jgi:hypothetical protein
MIVSSGVLFVWYGAHVTPRIFQENFIDVMVNIDRIDSEVGIPLVGVMIRYDSGRNPHSVCRRN